MFLHIGNNRILEVKDIIGIFNLESIENTKEYQKIKESLQDKRCIEKEDTMSKNKTFILTKEKGQEKGYFSNISSFTIAKRNKIEKQKTL